MAERPTLAALLPERLDGLPERARGALCENEDIGAMSLAWDYIGAQLETALKTALDCDLLEVFAKGWAKAQLLADYADPARHPAGERSVVDLGGKDFSRELHPVIAVTIGSCPCVELKFTFTVTAHFAGLRLAVGDGYILGADLGEASASAQLTYNGVPLHGAAESRKVPLPGRFTFDAPGIAIPRLG